MADAVKGALNVGNAEGALKAKRNTLLLSKWAADKPTDVPNEQNQNVQQPYYRSVALSIKTKAGDFRIITAQNMYVESYSEDYSSGEFGTFDLLLKQKIENATAEQSPVANESLNSANINDMLNKAANNKNGNGNDTK